MTFFLKQQQTKSCIIINEILSSQLTHSFSLIIDINNESKLGTVLLNELQNLFLSSYTV